MTKKSIQNITGNKSQKHYEAFASKHGLIFTPNITDHDEPVKGVTHTKNCRDKYLIQGASQGHDVTIIERAIPSINYGHKLTWTILQLSTDTTLPHIYIDGHKHLQDIYQSVFTNFGHYRNIDQLTNSKLNYFSAHFATFGSPEETLFIDNFIDKKMLELIYHHGSNLDYEMDSHHIRIYNLTSSITNEQIEDMFVLAQNIIHIVEAK